MLHLDNSKGKHHGAGMRTTLTLETDLAKQLKELAHLQRRSFKQVVDETLRAGLGRAAKPKAAKRFRVTPKHCGFRPGVDAKLNQLADDLEAEAAFGKADCVR
jgi:hypothetical protein